MRRIILVVCLLYSPLLYPVTTCFTNGKVLRDHAFRTEDFWIKDATIVDPQPKADHMIDLEGKMVAPGLIDIQINGGWGHDFTNDPDSVSLVALQLPFHGVTSFLPTIISTEQERYPSIIRSIKDCSEGSTILGIHLEGPFFSPPHKGAHRLEYLQLPSSFSHPNEFYGLLEAVKLVTMATELPEGVRFVRQLRDLGIVVSIGHSHATCREAIEAANAGATLVTHLFNAMPPFHHREPGLIGAALTHHQLSYSIIADGIHTDPIALQIAWKSHPKGLILVTDAMAALGLPDGKYLLGSQEVLVHNKRATLVGSDTLAGSVVQLDQCVKNLKEWTGCSLVEAIEAASLHPARLLGIEDKKGTLNKGADADFIIIDEEFNLYDCFINGLSFNL